MNRKVKPNKQCFYRNSVRCQKLQQVFEEQSFGFDTGPQLFSHSFIALSITRCSKSAQKFTVRVHQVITVAMATTQLVLNQFKTFYRSSLELNKVSLPKTMSKLCELVKLCHIVCSSFFETQCRSLYKYHV